MANLTKKDLLELSRLHHSISQIFLGAANSSDKTVGENIMVNLKLMHAYQTITDIYSGKQTQEVAKVIPSQERRNDGDLEKEIVSILKELSIPANLKGYKYLKDAIQLAVFETKILEKITKTVYPEVATLNKTIPSRVERAIRHAIEVAWGRNDPETVRKYFGNTISEKGRPTNAEFLAEIVDYIYMH